MFGVLKKIFAFAGKREKLLVKSMIVAFVGAVFSALQVVAMMFSLDYIVSGQISKYGSYFQLCLFLLLAGQLALTTPRMHKRKQDILW